MDNEEHIAYNYLQTKNFIKIEYEPNGNIPPDFLLDGEIAVEVRRLNQHVEVKDGLKPLEELRFKIIPKIKEIIRSFETPQFSDTLIVSVSYKRPLKVSKKLVKEVTNKIRENLKTTSKNLRVQISENLELRFYRSELKLSKSIIFGAELDFDSGGLVISNVYRSLKLIVEEKEKKIKKYYSEYNEWWLVVIDYIAYGLDSFDFDQLSKLPKIESRFKKIIIVSPIEITESRELIFNNTSV